MIELRNVAIRTRNTIAPVSLSNINLRIEDRDKIAILGPPNGSVRLLIDVLTGANSPDSGHVVQTSRISWPIPSSSFFHKHQSFIANVRFIAHLYEMDQPSFIQRVLEFAEIDDLAEIQLNHCPKGPVSRLAFALGACLPFDIYLFTNTSVGEKSSREKYSNYIHELGSRGGLVVATSNAKGAQAYCDKAYVLDPAGCVYYDDMSAAAEHLARLAKRAGPALEEPEEDDDQTAFDDFF